MDPVRSAIRYPVDMRCAVHPDRLATEACGACGEAHCSDCLKVIDEEAICPRCLGSAARPPSDDPPASSPPPSRNAKLAGGAFAALAAAALVLLATRPGPTAQLPVVEPRPPLDERQARTADCFQALERAAVAVEIHRAERGTYPSDWSVLIPDPLAEAPEDPWAPSRSPLQLTVPAWDPDAIVLYSVGPDGHDDGGKAYSVETGTGDIVYRVR